MLKDGLVAGYQQLTAGDMRTFQKYLDSSIISVA